MWGEKEEKKGRENKKSRADKDRRMGIVYNKKREKM